MNEDFTFISIVSMAIIVFVLICTLIYILKRDKNNQARSTKVEVLIICLWSFFFIGMDLVLLIFASRDSVTGTTALFCIATLFVAIAACMVLSSKIYPATTDKIPQTKENCRGVTDFATSRVSENGQQNHDCSKMGVILRCCFNWVVPISAICATTCLCFVFLEFPSNDEFLEIPSTYLFYELLVIFGLVAGLYFIFQRKPFSFAVSMLSALLFGIAEYYVVLYKSSAILPIDLRSVGTALSVADGFTYPLTGKMLGCVILFCIALSCLIYVKDPLLSSSGLFKSFAHSTFDKHGKLSLVRNASSYKNGNVKVPLIVNILSIVIGAVLICAPTSFAHSRNWFENGLVINYYATQETYGDYGIIPSLLAAFQQEELLPPPGYNKKDALELQSSLADLYDQLIEESNQRRLACEQFDESKPNIILVMNESFSDLSFMNELGVGYDGPTFFKSFDAIAKGKANVGVWGGSTSNSEFEALTGTSLGYVSSGLNPYVLYDLSDIATLPEQFGDLGYDTIAIHPGQRENYNRDEVYPSLGFDEYISFESFAFPEMLRGLVRDRETYDEVLDQLAQGSSPKFIFDLTMQGHAWYDTGEIPPDEQLSYPFEKLVGLDTKTISDTNEYLSVIQACDKDLQYFIDRLSGLNEKCVLIFFGDHQPLLSSSYRNIFMNTQDEVRFSEYTYLTDYAVWANYDIAGSQLSNPLVIGYDTVDVFATKNGNEDNTVLNHEKDVIDSFYQAIMPPASLMSWTMTFIGAPLTDYQKADFMSRFWVQSNNGIGYMDTYGNWYDASEVIEQDGVDTYNQGMRLIEDVSSRGLFLEDENGATVLEKISSREQSEHDLSVMANVMRWITYMNFSEIVAS